MASTAVTGMVRIHATIKSFVTPHLTAETLLLTPTPMIAPVLVWVVLAGIPKAPVPKSVIAPEVFAMNPSKGLSLVID